MNDRKDREVLWGTWHRGEFSVTHEVPFDSYFYNPCGVATHYCFHDFYLRAGRRAQQEASDIPRTASLQVTPRKTAA